MSPFSNISAPSVVIVSVMMPLGGTSNFALNLCEGMRAGGRWTGVAAALREPSEVAAQVRERGLPMIGPETRLVLHEERIEHLYRQCASFQPKAAVGALSKASFDFLRYVPNGCLRIAMIQSDDEGVYRAVSLYLEWIDIVVGVSGEICRKMEQRLPAGSSVRVVHQPYGVPMPDRERPPRRDGPLRVLYLGRVIEEQKRVSMMARVIKATTAGNPDLTWTIAGDGPQLQDLRNGLADAAQRVSFLGAVPYQNVPDVLAGHDVYFLCSDYEGLPLSLLEAMGAGLVPVVSDLPSGISEVVTPQNGIRVPIHDEQAYVDAVLRLATDRDRLAACSANARTTVLQSHSTAAMTRRWEDMLTQYGPSAQPVWKPTCRATVPAELAHRWYLNPWLRPLRSILKRIR